MDCLRFFEPKNWLQKLFFKNFKFFLAQRVQMVGVKMTLVFRKVKVVVVAKTLKNQINAVSSKEYRFQTIIWIF